MEKLSEKEIRKLCKEWFNAGLERGEDIASYQDDPEYCRDVIDTIEDAEEDFLHRCYEAADNNRQYSPFEFTAKEINDLEEYAEEVWEAFDEGISAGIQKYWDSIKGRVEELIERDKEEAESTTEEEES